MKLASFRHGDRNRWGLVTDAGVIDCSSDSPTLRAALTEGLDFRKLATKAPTLKVQDLNFSPAIPDPDKIICVGLNYKSHVAESGREPPAYPMIFTRFPSSQVGHDQPIIRPRVSEKLDFEGELA